MTGKLLTPPEAAARLGLSKKILLEHVRAGEIRYINIGRGKKKLRRMFTEEDLAEFIAARACRDVPPCPSTSRKARRTTTTIFNSRVVAIAERLEQRAAEMRKGWSDGNESGPKKTP